MAVNNKTIDNMMLHKALEDIADGMSYLSASNVYNISVNELKKQFMKKYVVHVKPTKTEPEESGSGHELKPEQMDIFIRYISQTLLGTAKDIKNDFLKESQQWALDSTQRKTLWKNLRTQTESSMQKLLENGDCPECNLSDTLWQCFDYYMVHNMPLYQKLFGSYGDNPMQMKAMIHLYNLVGKHRVEYLRDAPVEVRIKCWINVGLDYMKKGHVCSLMHLQRRWHEMKMCARMYFLEYWSVFRRIRENNVGQETLHRPKYLHINIAVQYPHVMLKELQSWTRTRKDGGVITMEQFENDEAYKQMKETFKAIRKTVINFKDVVKETQGRTSLPKMAPKSELIVIPISKTSDENKNSEDDDVVMIDDDLPIKPCDDLRGIIIENIISSGDKTIKLNKRKARAKIKNENENYVSGETVVKSENQDEITIENDGPEDMIDEKNDNNNKNNVVNVIQNNPISAETVVKSEEYDEITIENDGPQDMIDEKNDNNNKNNVVNVIQNNPNSAETVVKSEQDEITIDNDGPEDMIDEKNYNNNKNTVVNVMQNNPLSAETVVKSEEQDQITIENDGPQDINIEENFTQPEEIYEEPPGSSVSPPSVAIKREPEEVNDSQAKRMKLADKYDNETDENRDTLEEPVEYDADFLKSLEREHNKLASDDEVGENETYDDNCSGENAEDVERIDDDIEIIEQKRETIVIDDEMESCKWNYITKMEKITKKVYGPLAVCKNPDFNQRLRRFTASFMIIPRNRSLLNQCKPCTIDLVNYQAIPGPRNIIPETDNVRPSGSGTINNLPQEVTVKQEKVSPEKNYSSELGTRVMPSRQSKFRSMTVPYPAPKRIIDRIPKLAPKPLRKITPKPSEQIVPKPSQEIVSKPSQEITPKQHVITIPSTCDDSIYRKKRNEILAMRVDSNGQPFMRSTETKNMRPPVSLPNIKKVITPSRPWWYQSPNTERDFGETTLAIETLEEILESLSEKTHKICKPKPLIMKKHRTEFPCCYMRKDIMRYERRPANRQNTKIVHLHSRENCECCCKEAAEKLDSNSFLFLELAPSIHPELDELRIEMVSANPDPTDELQKVSLVSATPVIASKEPSPLRDISQKDEEDVDVCNPTVQVTSAKNRSTARCGCANRGARNFTSRGRSRDTAGRQTGTTATPVTGTDVVNPRGTLLKPKYSKNTLPLIIHANSNESMATVSLGPSAVEPVYKFVVLDPVRSEKVETTFKNSELEPVASSTNAANLDLSKKCVPTRLDEELNSDDDIVVTSDYNTDVTSDYITSDEEFVPKSKQKKKKTYSKKIKTFEFQSSPTKNTINEEMANVLSSNAMATITKQSKAVITSDISVTSNKKTPENIDKRNVLQDLLDKSGISFEDGLDSEINVAQIMSTKDLHVEISPTASNTDEKNVSNVGFLKTTVSFGNKMMVERKRIGSEHLYNLNERDNTIDLTTAEINKDNATKIAIDVDELKTKEKKILPKVFVSTKELLEFGLKPGVISTKILQQKGLPISKKNLNMNSLNNTNLPNISSRNGSFVEKKTPDKETAREIRMVPKNKIIIRKTIVSPVKGKMVFVKPEQGRRRRCPSLYTDKDNKPDTIISLIDEDIPMVEEYLDGTLDAESSEDESLATLAKRKKDKQQEKVPKERKKDVFIDPISINLESDESSQDCKISSENCKTSVKSPQIYMDEEKSEENEITPQIFAKKDVTNGRFPKITNDNMEKPKDTTGLAENRNQNDISSQNTFGTNDTIYSYIVMSPDSPQTDETDGQTFQMSENSLDIFPNTDENFQTGEKSTEIDRI